MSEVEYDSDKYGFDEFTFSAVSGTDLLKTAGSTFESNSPILSA